MIAPSLDLESRLPAERAQSQADVEELTSLAEFLAERDPKGLEVLVQIADRLAAATFVVGERRGRQ